MLNPSSAEFVIGIDLGTTHSVLCFRHLKDYQAKTELFHVDQLVGPGEIARKPLLPSFRYHYANDQLAASDTRLPWQQNTLKENQSDIDNVIIGEWARDLGAKTQGRLISSAKSWLSHPNIDPQADILPWSSDSAVEKVSPVIASASYLDHFQQSWNYHHPEHQLKNQIITITVPASFNDSARALTLEAARLVGLDNVTLLEEPQAVCYDWYHRNKSNHLDIVDKDKTMLVCDVGGGTTDLSLIEMSFQKGELQLNRVAVGEHLMLGGDNIDLALAHVVEQRISPNQKFTSAALNQVIQQTRHAKELFLSEQPPSTSSITLLGRGSKLIAQSKTCQLTKNEVTDMVFNGFIPHSEFNELPIHRKSAIVEFGLPYTSDPAISKHIAEFIHRYHDLSLNDPDNSNYVPDALLVNGGIFNSQKVKTQVQQLLSSWKGHKVQTLHNGDPDLSVAFGAVEFGFARQGKQKQIGGGSPRNYFINLADRNGDKQSICLLPKGSAEDQIINLHNRLFSLTIGEPIKLSLFTTNHDGHFKPGDIVKDELKGSTPLPDYIVTIPKQNNAKRFESVYLSCQLSSIGTIKIECVSEQKENLRWALEFSIRTNKHLSKQATSELETKQSHPNLAKAKQLIEQVYGAGSKKSDPKLVKSLRNDLDKILGKKETWDIDLMRELSSPILTYAKNRRRTEVHERNWLKLASFVLRPGFGYPADDWRIEQLWPIFPSAVQYNKSTQSWSDWWNLWRRVCGGLTEQQQTDVFEFIKPYFVQDSGKNAKIINQGKTRSYEDMLRLAASLEHISQNQKIEFGEYLMEKLNSKSSTQTHWWAIGRLASRTAFYGSQHNVIPKHIAESWLETLLPLDWKNETHIAFAAVMIARKCGDRECDINDDLRQQILTKLKNSKASEAWISLICDVQETDEKLIKRIFGDSLPSGLTLLG